MYHFTFPIKTPTKWNIFSTATNKSCRVVFLLTHALALFPPEMRFYFWTLLYARPRVACEETGNAIKNANPMNGKRSRNTQKSPRASCGPVLLPRFSHIAVSFATRKSASGGDWAHCFPKQKLSPACTPLVGPPDESWSPECGGSC